VDHNKNNTKSSLSTMVIVASADQFLRLGLELVGFPDHQFVGAATNMVRWSSLFAATPTSLANMF
jgi:hypothetical protein